MTMKRNPTCARCGAELPASTRGRPRKYCSQSCKQRAYEQRNGLSGSKLPENAVVLSPDKVDGLRDRLYELRCAAEDVRTAYEERATATEMSQLCDELVSLAKEIEKIR